VPDRRRPLALVFIGCALVACTEPTVPVSRPRPVVVEAPQPLTGLLDADVFPGSVHAQSEVDLSFRVAGQIIERRVDMGARVTPGMVLAVLDPQDAQLNVTAARAAVVAAEADLTLAQSEEQRYRDLRARGFVGQSQLDFRLNSTRLALAKLAQAQAELNLAANQSRYNELVAEHPGVITRIMAEPGSVVAPGQAVLRFAADGAREIHIAVPEGRLDAVRAAPRLEIELFNLPGHRFRGRVRDIDPQADRVTRTHLARVTVVDADERVQLGATASVLVPAANAESSFRVPATALGTLPDKQPAVWRVVGDGAAQTVEPITVEVLRYYDGSVAVRGPLSTADRLVSAGVHRLVVGMAVQAITRSAPAAL